jgi:hypothetical protein
MTQNMRKRFTISQHSITAVLLRIKGEVAVCCILATGVLDWAIPFFSPLHWLGHGYHKPNKPSFFLEITNWDKKASFFTYIMRHAFETG